LIHNTNQSSERGIPKGETARMGKKYRRNAREEDEISSRESGSSRGYN
jgi:hypothetical protein